MNNAVCVVGNSSSFIRECAYLGVPAVIVGERQEDREHGRNVEFCGYEREEIAARLRVQAARNRFELDPMFGEGDAGVQIAAELAKLHLKPIKRNTV
jgi:UDP-N-acetylglucosamine 2-epimerase